MRRIAAFLNEIVVDFFWSQKDSHGLVDSFNGMLDEVIVVGDFSREGGSADNFDLSALIDKNILGVNVSYFLFKMFEFAASSYHVIEQIPDLSLEEVFF